VRIDMKTIQLTRGYEAIVDDEDYERLVAMGSWCAYVDSKGKAYAVRRVGGKVTRMHRVIMNAEEGVDVDHINRETTNNLRSNLRVATRQQNNANSIKSMANTSGYKGVSWVVRVKKWRAYIKTGHKQKHLGYYDDPVEAARAYDDAAKAEFGEYARTNF
jgi:hypothetical protein